MGGAIGAMSTVGVGSTFWIELDAAAAPELGSDFARLEPLPRARGDANAPRQTLLDRKSTRLNSSHLVISYAVFCLKKKKHNLCSLIVLWQSPPSSSGPELIA